VSARRPVWETLTGIVIYLLLGAGFGLVLSKAEILSWYRIQEMFRFQSFHMYGILGSAVATAFVGLQLIRRFNVRTLDGQPVGFPPKELGSGARYVLGGVAFGIGWAFTGACPGPLFALLGNGVSVMVVTLAAALLGTLTYAKLRTRLPH
jgi:uncharacterized membrane protein YedE/YeeE